MDIPAVNGMPVHYIDTVAGLEAAAATWLCAPLLALDTEFMRVRTFYARAALYQVCDGQACYLVDPLPIADMSALARVLESPVPKLMHSCSEDLEVMERHLQALPRPLVDTQVIAAFCGIGFSVGYQNIVSRMLGVVLDKAATRTDWLQRPLTPGQLQYAAEDVAWLPALWQELQRRLAVHDGRKAWAEAECADIVERFAARAQVPDVRGIGAAVRLDAQGLAVLEELLAWREERARRKDLPRSWVMADADLVQIAQEQPLTPAQLAAACNQDSAGARRQAPALIACVEAALASDPARWPRPLPGRLEPLQDKRVKALREVVTARAELLEIAPEMLARRRELEEFAREPALAAGDDHVLLRGWRREAVGLALRARLEQPA